jgi:RNA polymerase subunit RPABC4/transcription elongation factor Spt4
MVETKCKNCGAKIPDGAQFCPGCGTPKAVEKPKQQATQTQPATAPVAQRGTPGQNPILAIVNMLSSEMMMYLLIFIGLLIACIGGLINTFSNSINMNRAGLILNVLGCLMIGVSLLIAGMQNKNYDKYVRLGMILGGALIITFSLSLPA